MLILTSTSNSVSSYPIAFILTYTLYTPQSVNVGDSSKSYVPATVPYKIFISPSGMSSFLITTLIPWGLPSYSPLKLSTRYFIGSFLDIWIFETPVSSM